MSEIKHTEAQMHAVRDALAEALGDTYDCTRVWSAWGVGTMSQDDFVPVTEDDERLHELTIAALDASGVAELLEAAKEALALGSKVYHNGNAHEAAKDWGEVRRLLVAAIAKATGSQS